MPIRPHTKALALCALAAMSAAGPACRQQQTERVEGHHATVARALRPESVARGLQGLGALHLVATTKFHVAARDSGGGTSRAFTPQDVTTTTEVWLDKKGNFRVVEENDHDGGRQIVQVDDEIALQLRYGKLMRRPAREGERLELLAQAVGGPFAAWEVVEKAAAFKHSSQADGANIPTPSGFKLDTYHIVSLSGAADQPADEDEDDEVDESGSAAPPAKKTARARPDLRGWRGTTKIDSLDGAVTLATPVREDAMPALMKANLSGTFTARSANLPVEGSFAVTLLVTDLGQGENVSIPEESETLWLGQRTLPIEDKLLRNLPGRRDPADVATRR